MSVLFLAPRFGWLFARACGLIVIQCQDVKTLHQHFASCPRTRGFPPQKNQQGSTARVEAAETTYGATVRTTNSSPFNPVLFNEVNRDYVTFFSKHSVVFIVCICFPEIRPKQSLNGAEKSKLISFSWQQYVDKKHGATGAPCPTVNPKTVFSSSVGLKLPQSYTCDCHSWLEQEVHHPNMPLSISHSQKKKDKRPLNVSKFTVPSLFLDILGFACGCRGTVKENEDKPELSGRGHQPYLLWHEEAFPWPKRPKGSSGPSRLRCDRLGAFLSGQC